MVAVWLLIGVVVGLLCGFFLAVWWLKYSLKPVVVAAMTVIKEANDRMESEVEQAANVSMAMGAKKTRTMFDRAR